MDGDGKDKGKTKRQLVQELEALRRRVAALEQPAAGPLKGLPAIHENIVATVREPLVVLDAELRVVWASRSFYRTFQVTPQETEGRLIYELGNGQWEIPKLRRLLEEILPQNTSFEDFEVEHDFERIGRRTMVLNARRMYGRSGKTQRILLAMENLTERRRLESERRRLEEKWRTTLRSIGDGVISTDARGRVDIMNPEAETLTGCSLEEAAGKPLAEVFHLVNEETRRPVDDPVQKVLKEGRVIGLANHTLLISKDGTEHPIADSGAPIQDSPENITGVVLVFRDQTERRRAERALQEALEAARRSNRENAALFRAARAVLKTKGFDKAAPSIFGICKELTGAAAGYVALVAPDGGRSRVVLSDTGDGACSIDTELHMPIRGLAAEAYERRQPVVDNAPGRRRGRSLFPEGHVDVENVLFAPIAIEGKTEGLIGLANKPGGFDDDDVRCAGAFAGLAAVTLKASRLDEALEARLRQIEALAELGRYALKASTLQDVLDKTVVLVAEALGVEYTKVLELLPDCDTFLLRAGVGWNEGLVGRERVPAGTDSQAGYTLLAGKPVIVEDLRAEKRFRGMAMLRDHQVISGVSTVIGDPEEPFGILGAHSRRMRRFTEDDLGFIDAAAHLLNGTISTRRSLNQLKEAHGRLVKAQQVAGMGFWDWNLRTGEILLSDEACRLFGMREGDIRTTPEAMTRFIHPEDLPRVRESLERALRGGGDYDIEHRIVHPGGGFLWVHAQAELLRDAAGRAETLLGTAVDITALKAREDAERHARALSESVAEASQRFVETHDIRGLAGLVVERAVVLTKAQFGLCMEAVEKGSPRILAVSEMDWKTVEGRGLYGEARQKIDSEGFFELEMEENLLSVSLEEGRTLLANDAHTHKKRADRLPPGHPPLESLLSVPLKVGGRVVGLIAVANRQGGFTPRERADLEAFAGPLGLAFQTTRERKERKEAEKRLRRAERLEAVGQLAGGIAHDFNNMLSVMTGHAELALEQLDPVDPLFEDLREIKEAAKRSSDLTKQLLGFARKQPIAPQVLNLNEAVSGIEKMLRRLIGENIDFKLVRGSDLWNVKVDPSQIDQILANLVLNARDAIRGVGAITVETANVAFDTVYCRTHPGFTPGDYVLLAVSDTGRGMDRQTQERIFEPFYTTKRQAWGTGLGLATVYGIVKQNGGFINVYSEPGRGTAFKVYLPRSHGPAKEIARRGEEGPLRGTETILLVEDEEQILVLARRILERYGYRVLAARSPGEALALSEKHEGDLHLFLTDVVMPTMGGKELRDRLEAERPGLKTLFMSGYTANAVVDMGVLEKGARLIQKPFTPRSLVRKVREVLEENEAPMGRRS